MEFAVSVILPNLLLSHVFCLKKIKYSTVLHPVRIMHYRINISARFYMYNINNVGQWLHRTKVTPLPFPSLLRYQKSLRNPDVSRLQGPRVADDSREAESISVCVSISLRHSSVMAKAGCALNC